MKSKKSFFRSDKRKKPNRSTPINKRKRKKYADKEPPISVATTSAKSTKPQEEPKLGDIGYKFFKLFPGYGYFEGTVREIRLGAGTLEYMNDK